MDGAGNSGALTTREETMERREFVGTMLGAGALAAIAPRAVRAAFPERSEGAPIAMTVYKSPTCGCCKEWIKHMEANGFSAKVVDMDDLTTVKKNAGVPDELLSCHTALVWTYVAEGHVPADLVKKMLAEKPAILGLAVAGMVVGSPGMEQGATRLPYAVMAFAKGGKTSVYAKR